MKKVILIRFGEIFLKGKNRGYFEKSLVWNIRQAMQKFNADVTKVPGRYVVSNYAEDDEIEVMETKKEEYEYSDEKWKALRNCLP